MESIFWFIISVIPATRVGFLSKTQDFWSEKVKEKAVKFLVELERFTVHSTEQIEEVKDSSVEYIMNKFDLDYLLVGEMEKLSLDVEVYTRESDTLFPLYRKVLLAQMEYSLKCYTRGKLHPVRKRLLGSGEDSSEREIAEEKAYQDLIPKMEDFIRRFFALKGEVIELLKANGVKINLGIKDGVRKGMIFIARTRYKGYGFFRIQKAEKESAIGNIIKGRRKIKIGSKVEECPYGVKFINVDLAGAGRTLLLDDSTTYIYGIGGGAGIGRKYHFRGELGISIKKDVNILNLFAGFCPLFYIWESFSYGPAGGVGVYTVSQPWKSTREPILGEMSGTASGVGLYGSLGGMAKLDIGRISIGVSTGYSKGTKIQEWTFSKKIEGKTKTERIPWEYLRFREAHLKGWNHQLICGINFEWY